MLFCKTLQCVYTNATQTVHAASTFPVASVSLQALFTRFSTFSQCFRTVFGFLATRIMHLTQFGRIFPIVLCIGKHLGNCTFPHTDLESML